MTSASSNLIIPLAIAALSQFLWMRARLYETGVGIDDSASAAMAEAYSDTFLLAACIAFAGVIYSLLLKPNAVSPLLKTEQK